MVAATAAAAAHSAAFFARAATVRRRTKAAKIMQASFIVLITHIYPSCVATTALAAPRFAALRSTHELSSA